MGLSLESRRLFVETQHVLRLCASGRSNVVAQAIGTRLRSDTFALGLRRDLSRSHTAPPAKIPLSVRPLSLGDDLSMLSFESAALDPAVASERSAQWRMIQANLPRCWVAIGPDGKVCYMQWLIAPGDNRRIAARWGDLFPQLGPDEALLEGAYTGDAYRGQGIMAYAMSRIAEQAREFGARWVNTFVGVSNVASLKGCKKAGFMPYVRRTESWWLLYRRVRFERLPEGTPYPFDLTP
jgi:GNAT superfamily N-acetyltransferase